MRAPVSTAVAISAGMIVLLGYFIPIPLLQNVCTLLLGWAVALTGVVALIGIFNLVATHWRKLRAPKQRDFYSPLLILSFVVTLAAGLVLGPANANFQKVVTSIQVPVEATVMALLAITLTVASLRLLQRRKGLVSLLFVLSALVFLLVGGGFLAVGESIPPLQMVLSALNWLPTAGARGLLLGIALGSLTAGLRILLGADRPYSG